MEKEFVLKTTKGTHLVSGTKKLANVFWLLFFGLWQGIATIFLAISYMCTLVFIPVGIHLFRLVKLIFKPFDKITVTRFKKHGFLNVVWLIFGGFALFLEWKLIALFLKLTVVGIPVGKQVDKVAQYLLAPFGARIIKEDEYTPDRDRVHDADLVMRRAVANTDKKIVTREGKMTIGDYFMSKKAEMAVEARKVIQSVKSTVWWGILFVIVLAVAIVLNLPTLPIQVGGQLFIAPGVVGAWFAWQIVARAAKIYIKCYDKHMSICASKFDSKINFVCYKKYLKGLDAYLDKEVDITKKDKDGSIRGMFQTLKSPLDVLHATPVEATPNAIATVTAGPAAAQQTVIIQQAAPQRDSLEDLKKLKDLLDAGIITQKEFDTKKAELLKKI